MIKQDSNIIKSIAPSGWGQSISLWRACGKRGSEAREKKAISPEPDGVTSLSKWLRLMNEGMSEASSSRTCLPWLRGRPKRESSQGNGVKPSVVTTP